MLLAVASVMTLAACGGSGGGTTAPTITSVTAACSPSTILYGQTSQCSATVMGTGNFSSAVTWTASAGSISTSGLFTAPGTGNVSLLVTVTATSTQDTSKSGTATITVNPTQTTSNVQPIVVDAGPEPQSFFAANEGFVTVTVCVPNTSTCQNIDHVLVDTGSSGLRLLSSAGGGEFNLTLPNEPDSNGNPLYECLVFEDGFVWGNVATADITFTVAGEKAPSAPVQVIIPSSMSPAAPNSCSSQTTGPNEGNSLMALGANGIIGLGVFQQDCGPGCVSSAPQFYYDCPASGCNPIPVGLTQQVTNPVFLFATDNNGVLIQLPAVPNGGSANVAGSLISESEPRRTMVWEAPMFMLCPTAGTMPATLSLFSTAQAIQGASLTVDRTEFSSSIPKQPAYLCAPILIKCGIAQPPHRILWRRPTRGKRCKDRRVARSRSISALRTRQPCSATTAVTT